MAVSTYLSNYYYDVCSFKTFKEFAKDKFCFCLLK